MVQVATAELMSWKEYSLPTVAGSSSVVVIVGAMSVLVGRGVDGDDDDGEYE